MGINRFKLLSGAIIVIVISGILSSCYSWQKTSIQTPAPMQISERVKTVIAGESNSFVILEDGSFWVWGRQTFVAEKGTTVWDVKVQRRHIETLDNVIAVSSFEARTIVLTSDGTLWAWGYDVYALPDIHNQRSYNPSHSSFSIPVSIMDDVIAIAVSALSVVALRSDYTLWTWDNPFRVDINDDTQNRSAPISVMNDVAAVFADEDRDDIMMITTDGTLWTWNGFTHPDLDDLENGTRIVLPQSIERVMDDVSSVSVGHAELTMILGSDGTLWSWNGEFGYITEDLYSEWHRYPEVERVLEGVVSVSSNSDRTFAIKSDGTLWAWGSNSEGQLGDGTTQNRNEPVKIMDDVLDVSIAKLHTMAITSDGTLWTWGCNSESLKCGWLGDGTMRNHRKPKRIMDNVISISAGDYHSMAITANGNLWAWGDNTHGQLGTGTNRGEREQPPYRGTLPSAWLRPILILEYSAK